VGVSPEHQAVIFEKFRQVGDTLTQKPAGTGLGLAICRQIVERLGGRLWLESEPGRGSVFSFSLPLAPASAMAVGE
jgi:signal transduction histidine kinase